MPLFCNILLPLALPKTLTYRLPEELHALAKPGQRAMVRLGKNKILSGIIWEMHDRAPEQEARDILKLIDIDPILEPRQFGLWEWISGYYLCTPGEVMKAALPAFLKEDNRQPARIRKPLDSPKALVIPAKAGTALSPSQQEIINSFKSSLSVKPVHLLHGITSSGKTEIYIHLIEEQLAQNKQVLYLLPEIALTTQIISRLEKVFSGRMLIYHSRFTQVRRLSVWNQVLAGPAGTGQLILGVRSSVFLPFRDLGLIIVDEEHEHSYKQQDPAPRYHARDVSIVLGQMHKVPVLMGTATPSLESYQQAHTGKYQLLELNERFGGIEMPEILLADVRDARKRKKMQGPFSPILLQAIDETLVRGEQVILFQNRRGYSPYIECPECHWIPKCTSCDVSLTYHRITSRLECHYCGYSERIPTRCPKCSSTGLAMRGQGTERIEDDLQLIFPEAKLARLDLDSTRSVTAYSRILTDFEKGNIDILIGTQMISKGLDFNNVNLVGILDADQLLNYPDFRSFERSFQMMTQVSGRAGRRNRQGLVVIQCSDPSHPVLKQVLENNLPQFYRTELSERQQFGYPPYTRLIRLNLKHPDASVVAEAAADLATLLKEALPGRIMGPNPPVVSRIQGKYIQTILIKMERSHELILQKKSLASLIRNFESKKLYGSLVVQADVDPL
ncbi:MAG: primosomal protein N' [Bacteroidetes bacterium GWF2_49_14]|nr:MAG: primosomal protein N' [Bacteroidetes bacterium GWF2_49_14]HBB90297.1 primosomal protein N' [Bacteroidales bacterium]